MKCGRRVDTGKSFLLSTILHWTVCRAGGCDPGGDLTAALCGLHWERCRHNRQPHMRLDATGYWILSRLNTVYVICLAAERLVGNLSFIFGWVVEVSALLFLYHRFLTRPDMMIFRLSSCILMVISKLLI